MPTPEQELVEYEHLIWATVYRIARRVPPSVRLDELLAAAQSGLWEHLRKSPVRHENHMRKRVRGAVIDWLRTEDRISRRQRAKKTGAPDVFAYEDLSDRDKKRFEPSTQPKALRLLVAEDDRVDLYAAISKLPERDRDILIGTFVLGLSQAEMAPALGISAPRVSQIYTRALVRLRALLSEEPESPAEPACPSRRPDLRSRPRH